MFLNLNVVCLLLLWSPLTKNNRIETLGVISPKDYSEWVSFNSVCRKIKIIILVYVQIFSTGLEEYLQPHTYVLSSPENFLTNRQDFFFFLN